MAHLKQQTEEAAAYIRSKGFNYVEIWEHNFLKQKEDAELCSFLCTHNEVVDRLNPRDAFLGGRTNAIKLCHEGPAKYIDFTSLYPWVSNIFFSN